MVEETECSHVCHDPAHGPEGADPSPGPWSCCSRCRAGGRRIKSGDLKAHEGFCHPRVPVEAPLPGRRQRPRQAA